MLCMVEIKERKVILLSAFLLMVLTACGGNSSAHKPSYDTNDSNEDNQSQDLPENDPLVVTQWYLGNTGQSSGAKSGGTEGEDLNVMNVWKEYRGSQEYVIAVLDDGFDVEHPDLKDNFDLSLSYNYIDGSNIPSPTNGNRPHGTCVAGIISAKGWNGIGIHGVAPEARIAGLNVVSMMTEANIVDAVSRGGMAISSNSWGFSSNSLNELDSVVDALKIGCEQGRGGKGTVYVFAAGNNRGSKSNGNANLSALANNRYAMSVAAINADGKYASYSSFGSSIWVSGAGGEYGDEKPAIVSTDLTGLDRGWDTAEKHFDAEGNENGDYTNVMNGTSAACPSVTGVTALVMEANPQLSWREMRYVLASSARKNDVNDGNWSINGAGHAINYNYGFGVVDAENAVKSAKTFNRFGNENIYEYDNDTSIKIPDNENVSSRMLVDKAITIEYVDVSVTISGSQRNVGDLEIKLISPAGTESILAWGGVNTYGRYDAWRFGTARHLDENAQGEWRLEVRDIDGNSDYDLINWKLKIYGH